MRARVRSYASDHEKNYYRKYGSIFLKLKAYKFLKFHKFIFIQLTVQKKTKTTMFYRDLSKVEFLESDYTIQMRPHYKIL